mgnify:CR=1 FL=1
MERKLIEPFQLVQSTVPVIEYLEEINQVHSYLFYEVLRELVLVDAHMDVFNFRVLGSESLQVSFLLMEFFLV